MDFELNSDQKHYRDLAKSFSDKELKPNAAEWDKEAFFPKETLMKAGELGFLSLYVDTNLGGMGLGRLDASIVFEQLAQGCTSTTAFMTIHNMAIWMVSKFGSEELKTEWFPQLSSGKKLASYCLTEPGSGSDSASLRTTAKKDGDNFILNGSKAFISGSGATDCLVLMARTGDSGAKGISCFLIPADLPGIEYGKNEPKMGWKNQPTRLVSLTDVRISKDNLKSHDKFRDKYKIKFDLLADEELTTLKKYKVWGKKKFMGREFMGVNRTTFLIDKKGKIIKIWENVKVQDHAKEVLETVKNL